MTGEARAEKIKGFRTILRVDYAGQFPQTELPETTLLLKRFAFDLNRLGLNEAASRRER